ncbi:MAG: phage terminase small subunit P27 family [Clostridium sp.]
MGRQRKTVSTTKKHLTKKEKENRSQQEKKIKLDRDGLVVPETLKDNKVASEEFIRVVNEAEKIGLWDNLDLPTIVIYCDAWSHYYNIENEMRTNMQYTVQGKDSEKVNPLINAQDKYITRIMRCSSKLGLATTDRLKLIVPEPETKENKFMKYIKV